MASRNAFLALSAVAVAGGLALVDSPADYVDVLLGTKSRIDFSVGNILPFIGRPWGMNQWAPQTNNYAPNAAKKAWWFHPEDRELYGIRCTHQPSPWINDYGNFLFTTEVGAKKESFPDKSSSFDPNAPTTKYTPYHFSTQLNAYCSGVDGSCTTVNLTATERAAIIKITFPTYDSSSGWDQTRRIRLLLGDNSTDSMTVETTRARMYGWTQANNGGVPKSGPSSSDVHANSETCLGDMTTVKGTGYSGHDLYHYQVNITDPDQAATACAAQCCAEAQCNAWGLDLPDGGSGRSNCSDPNFPCCWIKSIAEDDGINDLTPLSASSLHRLFLSSNYLRLSYAVLIHTNAHNSH